MFHVKHRYSLKLFTDAEVAEDHFQNIFDIDAPSQPAERRRSRSKLSGQKILLTGQG